MREVRQTEKRHIKSAYPMASKMGVSFSMLLIWGQDRYLERPARSRRAKAKSQAPRPITAVSVATNPSTDPSMSDAAERFPAKALPIMT